MSVIFRGKTWNDSRGYEAKCPVCGVAVVLPVATGGTTADDFHTAQEKQIWSTIWTQRHDFTCHQGHSYTVLSDQNGTMFVTLVPTD